MRTRSRGLRRRAQRHAVHRPVRDRGERDAKLPLDQSTAQACRRWDRAAAGHGATCMRQHSPFSRDSFTALAADGCVQRQRPMVYELRARTSRKRTSADLAHGRARAGQRVRCRTSNLLGSSWLVTNVSANERQTVPCGGTGPQGMRARARFSFRAAWASCAHVRRRQRRARPSSAAMHWSTRRALLRTDGPDEETKNQVKDW